MTGEGRVHDDGSGKVITMNSRDLAWGSDVPFGHKREWPLTSQSLPTSALLDDSACERVRLPRERRLKMLSLASLIFFTTCGGAFGLEPLIGATGAGRAIVLILITPLVWSLPISLMVAELAGLMPEEGGYYVWIRETLGRFWGVQAGWWAMAYAAGVMAIFPVLFVSYLSFFFPSLGTSADGAHPGTGALVRWLAAVLMIASAMAVNLRSAKDVGRTAKAGAAFVLGAFLVMILLWLRRSVDPGALVGVVRNDFGAEHKGGLLLVLSILAFDCSGWDGLIQSLMYAGLVVLGLLALVMLRVRRPGAARNFRVPGGWGGLAYVVGAPFAAAMLLLFAVVPNSRAYWWDLMVVGLVVMGGVSLYWLRRRRAGMPVAIEG